jgi:hypothetical protein
MREGLEVSAPLLLGLALGMRHAFDPDHVVAMGTIVSPRPPSEVWRFGIWYLYHNA